MKVIYKDLKLEVAEEVYKPAEDTFLLADNLEVNEGEQVLELGTGCGLLSILAAEKGASVIATDSNPQALKCAKNNAENIEVQENIDLKLGDLFEPIDNKKFDLIIFNPPYLPVSPSEALNTNLGRAWNGGPNGRNVIDKFLKEVKNYLKPGGRIFLIQSSLSGIEKTLEKLKEDFQVETKSEKLSFEKLYLFKATLPD